MSKEATKDSAIDEEVAKQEWKPPKPQMQMGFVNGNKEESVAENELDMAMNQGKDGKNSSGSGQLYFTIILSLFLVVNIVAILLFVFDVGQIRTRFVSLNANSQSKAVANNDLNEKLLQDKKALEDERLKINEIQATQAQKEEELVKLKQDLDAKEKSIAEATATAAAAAAVAAAKPSPTPTVNKANLAETVKIYENMEASVAAKILSSIDMESKSDILKSMKKAKAAEILALMDSKESASILNAIMKK